MDRAPDLMAPPQSGGESVTVPSLVAAALGRDWIVLKGCLLAGIGEAPTRVGYVLVHPKLGIAVVDLETAARQRHLVGLLQRSLDAAGFTRVFGGYPPMVHCR